MAYVIAHEVGHHVQNELGILGKYHRMQQGLSEKERNAISVRIELQADYLAGVWGLLHSRPKSSRYRRYRRSHECGPCRR
ncbi:MAG: neutral zinc metallopeptidase [Streptococcus parasanguinis]